MGKTLRWHDKKPELAKAVHFLSALPEDLQTIIGDCIIQIAEKEYKVSDLLSSFKSMGTDKIMGLHQSQKKRRNYDNNLTMSKAINYIYILPASEQHKIAKQALDLMDCVVAHFEIHREFGLPANNDNLKLLIAAFLKGGLRLARQSNQNLKLVFQEQKEKKDQLVESKDGMIIRQD